MNTPCSFQVWPAINHIHIFVFLCLLKEFYIHSHALRSDPPKWQVCLSEEEEEAKEKRLHGTQRFERFVDPLECHTHSGEVSFVWVKLVDVCMWIERVSFLGEEKECCEVNPKRALLSWIHESYDYLVSSVTSICLTCICFPLAGERRKKRKPFWAPLKSQNSGHYCQLP